MFIFFVTDTDLYVNMILFFLSFYQSQTAQTYNIPIKW